MAGGETDRVGPQIPLVVRGLPLPFTKRAGIIRSNGPTGRQVRSTAGEGRKTGSPRR
jgi:hypothetical protein